VGGAPAVPLMTTDYDVRVVASFKQLAGALRSGPAHPAPHADTNGLDTRYARLSGMELETSS